MKKQKKQDKLTLKCIKRNENRKNLNFERFINIVLIYNNRGVNY